MSRGMPSPPRPGTSAEAGRASGIAPSLQRLSDRRSQVLMGSSAALALLASATSLAPSFLGAGWFWAVLAPVLVVTGTGMVLRGIGMRPAAVATTQFLASCGLVTWHVQAATGRAVGAGWFTSWLDLVQAALQQIRTDVVPVAPNDGLLLVLLVAFCVLAMASDALAVETVNPAGLGLVWLCLVTVGASLSDVMLPWWTFAVGALGLSLPLLVEHQLRRQRWMASHRGRPGARSSTGGAAGGSMPGQTGVSYGRGFALTSVVIVLATAVGLGATSVGTMGSVPGIGSSGSQGSTTLGLQPFTSLAGQLRRPDPTELFRVRGRLADRYLRSVTLSRYEAGRGWSAGDLGRGVSAGEPLPPSTGLASRPAGASSFLRIDPMGYRDNWMPVVGEPTNASGLQRWRYDNRAGVIYSQRPREVDSYQLNAIISQPTRAQLMRLPSAESVQPRFRDLPAIPDRVGELAQRLGAGKSSDFEIAAAITGYFLNPDRFSYSLQTPEPVTGDPLRDFLFHGRTGFCEQYASAAAVLMRSAGLPARVAVGFTRGVQQDGYRSVSTNDAHAWVEVFFPRFGWLPFDPTPLDDGRGILPEYLSSQFAQSAREDQSSTSPSEAQAAPQQPQRPTAQPSQTPEQDAAPVPESAPPSQPKGWSAAATIAATAGALLALLLPLLLRAGRRWWRLRPRVARPGKDGMVEAEAAWAEVRDTAIDHGLDLQGGATARTVARRLRDELALGDSAPLPLRRLLTAIERQWYAPATGAGEAAGVDAADVRQVLRGIRIAAPVPLWRKALPRSLWPHGWADRARQQPA